MKRILTCAILTILLAVVLQAEDAPQLKTEKEKVSYSIGVIFGNSLKQQSIDFDPNFVMMGIQDASSGKQTLLAQEEIKKILLDYQTRLTTEKSEKSKKQGAEFLATNKAKEGVITLPSGLQYKVLKQGTGPKPVASDNVVTNYRGTLVDGTVFDSSYDRGAPAEFRVDGVIKGWTEALQLMPVGSKWELVIPAELAYREQSVGNGVIPPYSTLIFEVELMEIKKPDAAEQSKESPDKPEEPKEEKE